MNKNELNIHESEPSFRLFTRVVSILGQARSNVARCVNHEIVLAYWLIGKEIIQGQSCPGIQSAILDGREPDGLTLKHLRNELPLDWGRQEKMLLSS